MTDASVTRFAKPRVHQPSADPPRSATDTGLYRRRLHRRRPHRENSSLRQTDALPRHPPALCWKRGSGAGRLGPESFSFVPDRDTRQRRPHRRRPQEAAALGNYATAGARRPHRPCVPRFWLGPAEPPPRRPRAGPAGRSGPVRSGPPGSDSPRAPLPTPNQRRKRRAPTGDTPSPPRSATAAEAIGAPAEPPRHPAPTPVTSAAAAAGPAPARAARPLPGHITSSSGPARACRAARLARPAVTVAPPLSAPGPLLPTRLRGGPHVAHACWPGGPGCGSGGGCPRGLVGTAARRPVRRRGTRDREVRASRSSLAPTRRPREGLGLRPGLPQDGRLLPRRPGSGPQP